MIFKAILATPNDGKARGGREVDRLGVLSLTRQTVCHCRAIFVSMWPLSAPDIVLVSVLSLRPYVISIILVTRMGDKAMNYGYQLIAADIATVTVHIL